MIIWLYSILKLSRLTVHAFSIIWNKSNTIPFDSIRLLTGSTRLWRGRSAEWSSSSPPIQRCAVRWSGEGTSSSPECPPPSTRRWVYYCTISLLDRITMSMLFYIKLRVWNSSLNCCVFITQLTNILNQMAAWLTDKGARWTSPTPSLSWHQTLARCIYSTPQGRRLFPRT